MERYFLGLMSYMRFPKVYGKRIRPMNMMEQVNKGGINKGLRQLECSRMKGTIHREMDVNESESPAEGICLWRGNDQARRQGSDKLQKI